MLRKLSTQESCDPHLAVMFSNTVEAQSCRRDSACLPITLERRPKRKMAKISNFFATVNNSLLHVKESANESAAYPPRVCGRPKLDILTETKKTRRARIPTQQSFRSM